jgi:hypothetical protein
MRLWACEPQFFDALGVTQPTMVNVRQSAAQGLVAVARLGPLPLQRQLLFALAQHRLGNFRHPVTLTEKINWRIIHDRREILRLTCDKLHTKRMAETLGIKVARVLWSGENLEDLAGVELSGNWVLKPNDGSRSVVFGHGAAPPRRALAEIARSWSRADTPARDGEWAYSQARRMYLVEEMLGAGTTTPISFKFFVFDGEPLFVHAISVGGTSFSSWQKRGETRWPPAETEMRLYTATWDPLDARLGHYPLAARRPPPPALPDMLEAARILGRGFDFMRVDLMGDGRDFFFGELTPYPHAGLTPFTPRVFDLELGSHWTLPRLGHLSTGLRQPA